MENRMLILLLIAAMMVQTTLGATYWVSPSGSAAWTACMGATDPGNYCSSNTANSNAKAGDTVYFKAGTYNPINAFGVIVPANSGSDGNWITFTPAPGEKATLSSSSDVGAAYIKGKHHIKVLGFTIRTTSRPNIAIIGTEGGVGSHHIEFAYNNGSTTYGDHVYIMDALGSLGTRGANFSHIWIHDNVLTRSALTVSGCGEDPDEVIRVGGAYVTNIPLNEYVTIERNTINHAGHALMDWYWTVNSVIKDNRMHNEPWVRHTDYAACAHQPVYVNEGGFDYTVFNGYYSHRVAQISDGYDNIADSNILIENNRFGHAGPNPNNRGANGLELSAANCIIRYNSFYNNKMSGLYTKFDNVDNNMIYSNTMFHNGWGYTAWNGNDVRYMSNRAVNLVGGSYNWWKNNLMYSSRSAKDIAYLWGEPGGDPAGGGVFASNWCNVATVCPASGDPQFVDPDISSPLNFDKPDLSLRSSSAAINRGTHLTAAEGQGTNSRTMKVQDARYFQDGTWGADMARGVTLFPDWIAVGTVDNAVQVSSINYDTNTITLATPLTWSSGAPVWLYKDSSGRRVLYGSAPDFGAHEYTGTATPPAACSDGTISGACSSTRPRYCSGTTLVDNCQQCGCPGSETCRQDGTCQAAQAFIPGQDVEAEAGTLTGMSTGTQVDTYIYTSSDNSGQAGYTFTIADQGRYMLQAKVMTPGADPAAVDSFYVGLNPENAQGNNAFAYDTMHTAAFQWDDVSRRGSGTIAAPEFDPLVWELSQGTHTFTFYGREANTWLDKIRLVKLQVECAHDSDTDCDGCVEYEEMFEFMGRWKNGQETLASLIGAISSWKDGCA